MQNKRKKTTGVWRFSAFWDPESNVSRSWLVRGRDYGPYHKLCRELETENRPSFVDYCRLTARTVRLPFPRSTSLTRDLSQSYTWFHATFWLIEQWRVRWVALCICLLHELRLTMHDWTCPTGTDWQQRDSARYDWLFTFGRLSVTDGWVESGRLYIALALVWCAVAEAEDWYISLSGYASLVGSERL